MAFTPENIEKFIELYKKNKEQAELIIGSFDPQKAKDFKQAVLNYQKERSFKPSQYGFDTKKISAEFDGKPIETVQRRDSAVWLGPEHGVPAEQRGWKWYEPKTGVYVDAPSIPYDKMGKMQKEFGSDAFSRAARNIGMGFVGASSAPLQRLSQMLPESARTQYLKDVDARNTELAKQMEAERNIYGMGQAGLGQMAGAAIPMAATTAALSKIHPSIGSAYASEALIPSTAARALPAATSAWLTTPGTASEALMAGTVAGGLATGMRLLGAVVKPAANVAGEYIGTKFPTIGKYSRIAAEKLGLPTVSSEKAAETARKFVPTFNVEEAARRVAANEELEKSAIGGVVQRLSQVIRGAKPEAAEITSARGSVKSLSNKLRSEMEKAEFTGYKDILEAAKGDPDIARTRMAKRLLELAEEAGDNPGQSLSTEVKIKSFMEKDRLRQLGDAKDALGVGVSATPSEAKGLVSAIDSFIGELESGGLSTNKSLISELNAWKKQILTPKRAPNYIVETQPAKAPVVSGGVKPAEEVRDVYGSVVTPGVEAKPSTTSGPFFVEPDSNALDYNSLGSTRRDLTQKISSLWRAGGATGEPPAAGLQGIKDELDKLMKKVAYRSNRPDLVAADTNFRTAYSDYSQNFKGNPMVQEALNTRNPSDIFDAVQKLGTEDTERFFKMLGDRGQKSYISGLIDKAKQDATANNVLDPVQFFKNINDLRGKINVGLTGENAKLLGNLSEVLEGIYKAAPKNPTTGELLAEGASKLDPRAGMAASLWKKFSDYGVDWAFDSPEGRKFLLQAPLTKGATSGFNNLLGKYGPAMLAEDVGKNLPQAVGTKAIAGLPKKETTKAAEVAAPVAPPKPPQPELPQFKIPENQYGLATDPSNPWVSSTPSGIKINHADNTIYIPSIGKWAKNTDTGLEFDPGSQEAALNADRDQLAEALELGNFVRTNKLTKPAVSIP